MNGGHNLRQDFKERATQVARQDREQGVALCLALTFVHKNLCCAVTLVERSGPVNSRGPFGPARVHPVEVPFPSLE